MVQRLVAAVKGGIAGTVLFANVVAIFSGMVPVALAKLALPQGALRHRMDRALNALVEAWIGVNGWWRPGSA